MGKTLRDCGKNHDTEEPMWLCCNISREKAKKIHGKSIEGLYPLENLMKIQQQRCEMLYDHDYENVCDCELGLLS